MKTTKKETLNDLVIKEAKNLKKIATSKEINRLDFNKLDAKSKDNCIYGLMTKSCTSKKANELILKCATRVYDTSKVNHWFDSILTNSKLNGKPEKVKGNRLSFYISPIERFIALKKNQKQNNKILIDFLQDKTKTLKFK